MGLFCRYYTDVESEHGPSVYAYHMATCSILLSANTFLLTATCLGKQSLARSPMRRVQVAAAVAAVGLAMNEYLFSQLASSFDHIVLYMRIYWIAPCLEKKTSLPVDGDEPLAWARHWASAAVITYAVGTCLHAVLNLLLPNGWGPKAPVSCDAPCARRDCNEGLIAPRHEERSRSETPHETGTTASSPSSSTLPLSVARYAFVVGAVVEEACSSFFARLKVLLFSVLLWSCQLALHPFVLAMNPLHPGMPEWAVSAAPISTEITLGQVSAMALLLDSLVGILNYSIGK